MFKKSFVL